MAKWRQNNGDRNDPWGFIPKDRSKKQLCFECGIKTTGRHHVVPKALGGSKVLPMCNKCHSKIHGFVVQSESIKAGLKRAKARGVKLGAKTKITKELVNKVKKLRKRAFTIKLISSSVNLSVGTIHKILKEL